METRCHLTYYHLLYVLLVVSVVVYVKDKDRKARIEDILATTVTNNFFR
jgi:hypothetical protein